MTTGHPDNFRFSFSVASLNQQLSPIADGGIPLIRGRESICQPHWPYVIGSHLSLFRLYSFGRMFAFGCMCLIKTQIGVNVPYRTLKLDRARTSLFTVCLWIWLKDFDRSKGPAGIRTAPHGPVRTSNGLQRARLADTTFQNYGTATTRTRVSERSPLFRSRWVYRLKSGLVAPAKPSLEISFNRGRSFTRITELCTSYLSNTDQNNDTTVAKRGLRPCHRRQRLSTELNKPSTKIHDNTLTSNRPA